MKTPRNFGIRLAIVLAASISIAGFSASASARALPQNAGQQGSGGQRQPQTRPAPRPQPPPRPQPGKPSDRPTIQPVPGPGRPQPGKPINRPNPNRPVKPTPLPGPRPQPGKPGYRPPSRPPGYRPPPYNWRPGDYDYMRRYYRRNFGYINRGRRPIFVIGGYIPFGDRGYFTPVPPHLLTYLPPPPPGYVLGYFDGYIVVYDPITYEILSFADLLT